ncbi:MAG: hypothetical protein RIS92_2732 [Verrucomicrobiota bacterium]
MISGGCRCGLRGGGRRCRCCGLVLAAVEEIGDVEEGEVGHEGHGCDGATRLKPAEVFWVEGFPSDAFDEGEGDVAAVENGEGKQVGECEVHVEEDGEREREEPASFVFKNAVIDLHDADGSAEVLGAYVAAFRKQRIEHVDDGKDGVADLVGR